MGSSLVTLLRVTCCMWELKFPDQGLNPGPLNWERGVLSTGPPGKSGFVLVFFFFFAPFWLFLPTHKFTVRGGFSAAVFWYRVQLPAFPETVTTVDVMVAISYLQLPDSWTEALEECS